MGRSFKKIRQTLTGMSAIVNLLTPIYINPLTPNDSYRCRTATLSSKRCILYIYSTNIDTEYFKHGIYCPFSFLQYAVCFIILNYLVPVLFTFYIQGVLKIKNNSGAKMLNINVFTLNENPLSLQRACLNTKFLVPATT